MLATLIILLYALHGWHFWLLINGFISSTVCDNGPLGGAWPANDGNQGMEGDGHGLSSHLPFYVAEDAPQPGVDKLGSLPECPEREPDRRQEH